MSAKKKDIPLVRILNHAKFQPRSNFLRSKIQPKNQIMALNEYDSRRLLRHADRLLEDSDNLVLPPDLEKEMEKSSQHLADQKQQLQLIHQSKKEIRKFIQAPALNKELTPSRPQDPDLDELQYEPLKGIGKYGNDKLLNLLKTKRDNVLQNGGKFTEGDGSNNDGDDGLGTAWTRLITMNSSVLDETLSKLPTTTSKTRPPRRPPSLTKMSGVKMGSINGERTSKTKAVGRAYEDERHLKSEYGFKEGEDYFFNQHPPFMEMVEETGDLDVSSGVRSSPAAVDQNQKSPQALDGLVSSPFTKKLEMKSPTTTSRTVVANVLYKPLPGRQFIVSGPESKTPSGLLELDTSARGKDGQPIRVFHTNSNSRVVTFPPDPKLHNANAAAGTLAATGGESVLERQKRIREEFRHRTDTIRLFAAGRTKLDESSRTATRRGGKPPVTVPKIVNRF